MGIKPTDPAIIASIGGSDSSAGAGIQGDIKTAMAMGAWCHTVITAVTAQTPEKVFAMQALSAEQVGNQLRALFTLGPAFVPAVVKTGMLATAELVGGISECLREQARPLVVDTVLKASSGADLGNKDLPQAMCDHLLPLASLLTPNLPEAAVLLDCDPAETAADMREQAMALRKTGASAVLLKGGHLPGEDLVDVLVTSSGVHEFKSRRIPGSNTHGSGCALASAIAVGLAQGKKLEAACAQAKKVVEGFIRAASQYQLVKSNGPLVHFNLQETKEL